MCSSRGVMRLPTVVKKPAETVTCAVTTHTEAPLPAYRVYDINSFAQWSNFGAADYAAKITEADRLIDWRRPADAVANQVRALAPEVGAHTELGKVAARVATRQPETDFEHGLRRFGYLLLEVTLLLVLAIFAVNVFLARPVLESLMFSLALAIGLTPQLLPAIVAVNLARGAARMAAEKTIVRRLASIAWPLASTCGCGASWTTRLPSCNNWRAPANAS